MSEFLRIQLLVLLALPIPLYAGELEVVVVDRYSQEPIPCRMHLRNDSGRPRKVAKTAYWHDHFPVPGRIDLTLPVGTYHFEIERGLEYVTRGGYFTIDRFAGDSKEVDLKRFVDMTEHGWYSGDLDIRRPLFQIEQVLSADDLHVAPLRTWSLRTSFWRSNSPPGELLVRFDGDRCYHLMGGTIDRGGGSVGVFGLAKPLSLTSDSAEYPSAARLLEYTRKHHPVWVDLQTPYSWDLPVLVAGGLIDSVCVAHGALRRDSVDDGEPGGRPRDQTRYPAPRGLARWSQDIYFHLLNCGISLPPTAGSGSGDGPNPVGYNRLYVHVEKPFTYERWWENLRAGRVVVTNGPLLRPSVRGELPGHVFNIPSGESLELEIGLTLSTREPISYIEVIKNGRIDQSIAFRDYAETGRMPKITFTESGWFALRAVTDHPKTYRFALTGPYFVHVDGRPRISRASAEFFLEWVFERARQIKLDDPAQQREVLAEHQAARDFWQDLVDRANAP